MIEATGAQIIVKMLERQGIRIAAGIPGGSVLPLYDELSRSSIRHILVRHEQAGGFIAQGIARSTGNAAVCFATSGPGAMNLLTALADARSDSVPLVAITGQVNTSLIGTDAFQEADTFGLSFPITKHSIMVKRPEELLDAIPRAFRIALSGRPGPVLIDVPRDVQTAYCKFNGWPPAGRKGIGAERFKTEGEDFSRAVAAAAELLAAANRPVLYVGGGCNSPEGAQSVRDLLNLYPMPVTSSLMGIGIVPGDDPAWIGMVGMHGAPAANRAMYEADAVIAAGSRFDDRAAGIVSQFCPNARIIHADIDAAEINKILDADVSVVGDCACILTALTGALRERMDALDSALAAAPAAVDASAARAGEARNAWLGHTARAYAKETGAAMAADANTLRAAAGRTLPSPGQFIKNIPQLIERAGLNPKNMIVTTDVGQHQMWAAQYYPVSSPRTFLTSGSLGTMGFGLPAAIGAALANPGKRVICFTGDGSLQMNIQELATLAELNLDVTVILLDNGVLGMVRQQQELLFAKNYSASIYGRCPDLLAVARAFGICGVDAADEADGRVNNSWHMTAFPPAGGGPRFVRCFIGAAENVYPFVPAGKPNIEAITG